MEDPKTRNVPALGQKTHDYIASVLRGGIGMVPIIGSALAEVVAVLVPNQRIERVEAYLQFLAEELANLENAPARLKRAENIDLIEDGAYQSVRALNDERKRFIARCVASGIAADELEKIREKRVLNVLGQLDDEEIRILHAFNARSFDAIQAMKPPPAFAGSPQKRVEDEAIWNAAVAKLERLSLLNYHINVNLGHPGIPEYDSSTGRPRGYHQISELGRIVLKKIGLIGNEDDLGPGLEVFLIKNE